jgi:dolichol-phosphate mannosyltransferase
MNRALRSSLRLLALVQAVLGLRVVWRLVRTGRYGAIPVAPADAVGPGALAVVVPVLDEEARLAPCLDGLMEHGAEVGQILVVDGGSTDGTAALVRAYARRDCRVRLVLAGPAPPDWNGKVWGLQAGWREVRGSARWLLTLDADVRPAPPLARSLVAFAEQRGLRLMSVATRQRVSGLGEGLLHPSLLATLVYRFGRPGTMSSAVSDVMANGQCMLVDCDQLEALNGFLDVNDSLCEDVTFSRLAARAGTPVGFFQADGLVEVSMFSDWREAWRNWPRSLSTRDALFGISGWVGLFEVLLVQALPLPLAMLAGSDSWLRRVNLALLTIRLGTLVGSSRAYVDRPASYWLSPLLDLPVALALWRSALRQHHVWRSRTYTRQKGILVA